jgi:hypothetical protein
MSTCSVTITAAEFKRINMGRIRFTFTLTSPDLDKEVAYGITMGSTPGETTFDPFWANFLAGIGHTEETLPEEQYFPTKAAAQAFIDGLFVGRTGQIYYLPHPSDPARCRIKWLPRTKEETCLAST